jgi:hypothetical protein
MKKPTLMHSSILAAVIIGAVVGASMVSGFSAAKPFISADPISDKNIGDQFTITGKTSLPVGSKVLAQVYPAVYEDQTGTGYGEFSGATGTIAIEEGTDGSNSWSFKLDTSTFKPMEYLVNVSLVTGDLRKGDFSTGNPFNTTKFNVIQSSSGATAGRSRHSDNVGVSGILIDPIQDTAAGKLLELSGKTSLPVGADLIVKVVPVVTDNGRLTGDYKKPENIAVTKVVKSSGTANRFSITLDTRLLPLADHIVTVSNVKGTANGISSEPGTVNGTAVFNIIAEPAGTIQDRSLPAIYINPISDTPAGDPLVVSGTTNVPAGSKFRVSVVPVSSTDFQHPELAATISAIKGSTTGNLFSVTLATNGLRQGKHAFIVSADDADVTGSILFTITA